MMKKQSKEENYRKLFLATSLILAFLVLLLAGGSDEIISYAIWILVPLLFYFIMKKQSVNVIEEMGLSRSNLKNGILVSVLLGLLFGGCRYVIVAK